MTMNAGFALFIILASLAFILVVAGLTRRRGSGRQPDNSFWMIGAGNIDPNGPQSPPDASTPQLPPDPGGGHHSGGHGHHGGFDGGSTGHSGGHGH